MGVRVLWVISFAGLGLLLGVQPGQGQQTIVPEGTMGVESSQVIPNAFPSIDLVVGGARRGNNLFHSFEEFGIAAGRSGYFIVNDLAIQNILARVTGTKRSEIFGILGTRAWMNSQSLSSPSDLPPSPANLFLINPNGIIFGPSSQVDVGASFMATTAKSVSFGDQGFFDVDRPNLPTLLTISPSAFLFDQTPGSIINNSGPLLQTNLPVDSLLQAVVLRQSIDPLADAIRAQNSLLRGLRVPEGQSLVLLGGEVINQNSSLSASGGRIEVGSIAGAGTVGLTINDNDFQLNFPDTLSRSDILLINSSINTLVGGRGNISLTGRDIKVTKGSVIVTGIIGELGTQTSKSGDININATRNIEISDTSRVLSATALASGNSGNINLKGKNIIILNGSNIASGSVGGNDAGTVLLKAEDTISISGRNSNGLTNNIVTATAGFPRLTQQGNGGNIKFEARDISLFDDASVFTNTLASKGNSGSIELLAKNSFSLKDGSLFSTTSSGQGNAGDIAIRAGNTVQFNGVNTTTGKSGGLQSNLESLGILPVERKRQAGNLTVEAGSLEVTNGAWLNSSTSGKGDAGAVTITARSVLFDGTTPTDGRSSGIFTNNRKPMMDERIGAGGDVLITTPQFQISNGAVIDSRTVNDKPGGTITLNLDQLSLLSGGQILSTSDGSGPAGTVRINATEGIRIAGSDPTYADRLARNGTRVSPITANSGIYARSTATGDAGDVIIGDQGDTPSIILDRGEIDADSNAVNGGNITLTLNESLFMRNGSLISATAGQAQDAGDGGNITINSPFVLSVPQENNDIIANAFRGTGGNITINAQGILNFTLNDKGKTFDQLRNQPTNDISASSEFGSNGTLNLAGLNVDPSRGSVQLPIGLIDNTDRIDTYCAPKSATTTTSSFIVSGRGGLPSRPGNQSNTFNTGDIRDFSPELAQQSPPIPNPEQPLTEAQLSRTTADGKVHLLAGRAIITPKPDCPDPISAEK
jgi:filamentous hemagglutinin family protein